MGWLSKWFGGGRRENVLDREATNGDLAHLRDFARTRLVVEFYVEPETYASDTTVVVVAADGEWTRRRVGSHAAAEKLAAEFGSTLFEAAVTGYPERMKEWSRRHPERKLR